MGKADTVTKQYMEDNQVFADAFNYLIYGGRAVIQPEKLHCLDSVAVEVPYGSNGAELPVQKVRDELKYLTAMADEHAAYVILGIENQDEIHYAMPVKIMSKNNRAIGFFQSIKDRDPVLAGRFHTDFRTMIFSKPITQFLQSFGKRRETSLLVIGSALGISNTNTGKDPCFVDI